MTRNPISLVKFLICAYWAKKGIMHTIRVFMLVTVFTISFDFQNRYIFFKTLLLGLFTMLYVTLLTSEIKIYSL